MPLIHLGADLLPKGSNMLAEQKRFINGFLKNYYQKAKNAGIDIIASFGNDDLFVHKQYSESMQAFWMRSRIPGMGTSL